MVMALLGGLVGGCATPAGPSTVSNALDLSYAGRLAVRVEATSAEPVRQATVRFDLQGRPEAGRLQLDTPIGTALAQARWSDSQVSLQLPDRPVQIHASLAALTQELLGAELPIAALFSWLNGEPMSGAAHARFGPTPEGQAGFEQLGWRVDISRRADGVINLQRAAPPRIDVRVRLDETPARAS